MARSRSLQTFQIACDELGAFLEPFGFTYRRSKRESRRQGRLFEHVISFRTSRSINSLSGHVHLEVSASAWSTRLAEFRQRAGTLLPINEAVLFGTTIENVFRPAPPYVRYDVGEARVRDAVLKGIEQVLECEVMRMFELIESPDALRGSLDAGPIPCLSGEAIRDYFECFKAD